jgi:phosphopantetheine--protein transferase-like protein
MSERVESPAGAVPAPRAHRAAPSGAPLRAPASATRIGCDVVELGRLERVLARNPPAFRDQIFTAAEQAAAGSVDALARRFAVKEATLKALGIGLVEGVHPTDIEVTARDDGRCEVRLAGAPALLGRGRIIHARSWIEAGHASAIVWLGRDDGGSV